MYREFNLTKYQSPIHLYLHIQTKMFWCRPLPNAAWILWRFKLETKSRCSVAFRVPCWVQAGLLVGHDGCARVVCGLGHTRVFPLVFFHSAVCVVNVTPRLLPLDENHHWWQFAANTPENWAGPDRAYVYMRQRGSFVFHSPTHTNGCS